MDSGTRLEAAPLVSIGMPVRNCAGTLEYSIRSILAQSYRNWELLLINDGSSDDTLEVISQFPDPRIRVFSHNESRGLAVRLNQALDQAHGKYFARMDGDDICFPDRLAKQVAFLEANPVIDLLGSGAVIFDPAGGVHGCLPLRPSHAEICAEPWAGFYLAHPSWMGHLTWFLQYRYDECSLRAQDQELLLRSYRDSQFAALPDVLLGYRQDRRSLWSIWRSRWYFGRALFRQALHGDRQLFKGGALLAVKFLADLAVLLPGRQGGSMRCMRSIEPALSSDWQNLWTSVNAACLQHSDSRPERD